MATMTGSLLCVCYLNREFSYDHPTRDLVLPDKTTLKTCFDYYSYYLLNGNIIIHQRNACKNIVSITISLTVLRKGVKIINTDNGPNRTFEHYWMEHCNWTFV